MMRKYTRKYTCLQRDLEFKICVNKTHNKNSKTTLKNE